MLGLHKKSLGFLSILLVGLVALSGVSEAQSSRDTLSRLQKLENEIRTLNRAVYSQSGVQGGRGGSYAGGDPVRSANAEVRAQQLEIEIRTLTGRMEQQTHQINQLRQQLEKMASDMELRIQDLESGRGSFKSGSSANVAVGSASGNALKYTAQVPQPKPQPSSQAGVLEYRNTGSSIMASKGGNQVSSVQPSAGQLGTISHSSQGGNLDMAASAYENAFALLKTNSFDAAEKQFESFLSQYPDHVLSSNARYWYGETFYVRGNYERSARIFAESYQQAPQGPKSQDNLLKLGMSLAGMGNKKDACVALRQLKKEGAHNSSPITRRGEQELSRLSC